MIRSGRPLDTGNILICLECDRRLHGLDRGRHSPIRPPEKCGLDFRIVPSPTWSCADHVLDRRGIRNAVVRHRRIDGTGMQGLQGRGLSGAACSRRCRSPAARRTRGRNIALSRIGRQAVMADPDKKWHHGRYSNATPSASRARGARRAEHQYMWTARATAKFGRRSRTRTADVFVRRGFPGRSLFALPGLIFVERSSQELYLY